LSEFREKYIAQTNRLTAVRQEAANLKVELARTINALKREVGEESIEAAMAGGTDWRGRAQEIVLLRGRIKKLKEKQPQNAASPKLSVSTRSIHTTDLPGSGESTSEEPRSPARFQARKKLEQRQKLEEENAEMKASTKRMKHKLEAVQARNTVVAFLFSLV
jgi:hypothetical protein